ncbi:OVARIAN TUMOR DOMAIN-containing deubiquitinating enzyme 9-like [Phoenix dactylifera]|uniref:ubiquitinyl hydrolase 1 n=1 Tax=Phoenix dactylifera TaxID=42345 RepID=A0A8B9A2K2_PHODC|nr:OVARIAN TUMOR DOMAIN-containing deubiquitinating enzyme 9-like [Phoenix dactylifera]
MIMYEQDPDVIRWGLHLLQGDQLQILSTVGLLIKMMSVFIMGITPGKLILFQCLLRKEQKTWKVLVRALEKSYMMASSNSIELTDDSSTLDGEVGKRLNQMVPVRHVPRINGEIPSADEATTDHQRLLDRLKLYDLVELKVQGDGNCQFRALSDQFYRTTEHHKFVRQQIVNQLKSHREIYDGYVPMAYDEYLKKMSKNGEWGDHVTLQAAADSYGVRIFILTSFKDTCYIEILPNVQKSKRVIFLSFWAEVHYNSIYPEGELPTSESKKKKRWWHFGNMH